MMESINDSDKCPQCYLPPVGWRERRAHNSRELYWIGCRRDGQLAGGLTRRIAIQNWNRMIARWKFDNAGKVVR